MKKPKPNSVSKPEPSTVVNGLPADVLTLAEAAAYLRLPEAEVVRLVNQQDLPGRLAGSEWRFLKSAIQAWLSQPPPRSSKEAQLAIVGSWKDDPNLETMVEEIYRQRGRPITEDGSYRLFHGLNPEGIRWPALPVRRPLRHGVRVQFRRLAAVVTFAGQPSRMDVFTRLLVKREVLAGAGRVGADSNTVLAATGLGGNQPRAVLEDDVLTGGDFQALQFSQVHSSRPPTRSQNSERLFKIKYYHQKSGVVG
jgi:excisionase family DNA binding protein